MPAAARAVILARALARARVQAQIQAAAVHFGHEVVDARGEAAGVGLDVPVFVAIHTCPAVVQQQQRVVQRGQALRHHGVGNRQHFGFVAVVDQAAQIFRAPRRPAARRLCSPRHAVVVGRCNRGSGDSERRHAQRQGGHSLLSLPIPLYSLDSMPIRGSGVLPRRLGPPFCCQCTHTMRANFAPQKQRKKKNCRTFSLAGGEHQIDIAFACTKARGA